MNELIQTDEKPLHVNAEAQVKPQKVFPSSLMSKGEMLTLMVLPLSSLCTITGTWLGSSKASSFVITMSVKESLLPV